MSTFSGRLPIETAAAAAGNGYHRPVLVGELLEGLESAPDGILVDATVGGGGHSEAILDRRPGMRVVGCDRDPNAVAAATVRLARFGARFVAVHAAFGDLPWAIERLGVGPVSAVIADLGLSSHQIDTPERGFSLQHAGPLDMRMDPSSGEPLAARLGRVRSDELADVLYHYGDVRQSRRAARALLEAVAAGVADTAALASRLAAVLPRRGRLHPATQAFQALRIWVNDEMGQLDRLLAWAPERLAEGGVLGIISFHSGEDRRVKRRMRDLDGQGFRLLTRRAQLCSPREEEANPRARSARLRLLRREATMTAAPRGQVDRWGQP